ncbi:MAG: glycosyltransferase family 2 protein [Cyclobacteriaceae bacterium]|nr:glycosyltransferase family 2 protein [Cyclobacteriaceae bacterium]
MNEPLISIVIPVYNRPVELKRAISSVLSQTYQIFEVIIIDDCSTYDLRKVIEVFKDERLVYHKLSEKRNANVARNLGAKLAKGTYIAFLDSDDEWMPFHLERRIQKIQEWRCDGIFGSAKIFHNEFTTYRISRKLKINESFINYLLSDGFAQTTSFFFKNSALKNIFWNEELKRHQDYDFIVRLSESYKLFPDAEPTIIIHWEENKVTYHFDSCIKFINANKAKIEPKIYNKYHSKLLWFARNEGDIKFIKHYEKEAVRYPKYLSLSEFLNTSKKRKFPFIIYYKLKFGFLNFF